MWREPDGRGPSGWHLANILRKLGLSSRGRGLGTRGPHLTAGVCGVRGVPDPVPAVVTESATPLTLGRYTSAYQGTFSIADIICRLS